MLGNLLSLAGEALTQPGGRRHLAQRCLRELRRIGGAAPGVLDRDREGPRTDARHGVGKEAACGIELPVIPIDATAASAVMRLRIALLGTRIA